MACDEYGKYFDDYLQRSLSPSGEALYERHCSTCSFCRSEIEAYRLTERFLSTVALPSMPESFWKRQRMSIVKSIAPGALWSAPSYSLTFLLAIVVCYVFAGFNWLFACIGSALFSPIRAVSSSRAIPQDGFDTVILLYLGLFALALMAFLSDSDEERRFSQRRN